MKKCPYCGAQMNDDSLFCTECGKPFPQSNVCPHCGASMNEGDTFCQKCGKKLNELPSNVIDTTLRNCHFCGAEINDGDAFCGNCGANLQANVCPQCGASVDANAQFCSNCGNYLSADSVEETVSSQSEYVYEEEGENPIRKYLPYIIGTIALVAICCGGWWYFNSSKSSQTVNDGGTVAVDSIAEAAEEVAIADTLPAADIVEETYIDNNTGVEMPNIHKIGSLFSEMESGKLTALKDYGFTLDDRQSKMIMSDYAEEGDEADIKLTKETYSLKYKIGNPSDMSEGRMKIRYVYAKDYGEPYMTIECDSKTWNSLKFEAESSLKKLEGNSYFLDMSSFINFDYEGAITVSTENSVTWE